MGLSYCSNVYDALFSGCYINARVNYDHAIVQPPYTIFNTCMLSSFVNHNESEACYYLSKLNSYSYFSLNHRHSDDFDTD